MQNWRFSETTHNRHINQTYTGTIIKAKLVHVKNENQEPIIRFFIPSHNNAVLQTYGFLFFPQP